MRGASPPPSLPHPIPPRHHGKSRVDTAQQVSPSPPADQCPQTYLWPPARQYQSPRGRPGRCPQPRSSSPERRYLRPRQATLLYQIQCCSRFRCQRSPGPCPAASRPWWWLRRPGRPVHHLAPTIPSRRSDPNTQGRPQRLARPRSPRGTMYALSCLLSFQSPSVVPPMLTCGPPSRRNQHPRQRVGRRDPEIPGKPPQSQESHIHRPTAKCLPEPHPVHQNQSRGREAQG
jgi:hypothetical protein